MRKLPWKAQVFVATIWLLGALAIAGACLLPAPAVKAEKWEMGLFVLLGMVAGRTKVRLMRGASNEDHGTITLGFIFTFTALLRLGPGGAVLVGALSMLSSCVFPKRLPLYQAAFNTTLIAFSTFYAGRLFLILNRGTLDLEPLRSLPAVIAASGSIFLIEAGAVATVIALCTGQSLPGLLKENFLWTAPSYLAAAGVSTLAVLVLGQHVGIAVLYLSPAAYLLYQSYGVYTARALDKQRHGEELHEREERLRLALRAAQMGTWDMHPETGEMVWSEHAAIFGAMGAAFGATKDAFLASVHPDDRPTLEQKIADALRSGSVFETEVRVRRPDGSVGWLGMVGQTYGEETDRPMRLSGVVQDITERKQSEEQIRWQAYHDRLTHLPNRALLEERAEQMLAIAQRTGEHVAVLFLDLDRFKQVNDTLGHAAGDDLLRQIGQRLAGCLRVEDTAARLGGDEFAVLLPGIHDPEDAAKVAHKIQDALAEPIHLQGQPLTARASIGISLYPADGRDIATLLQNADAAMYRAKEGRRGTYRLYTPAMNARAAEHLAFENDLHGALEREELILFYQPQVALASGKIIGLEALLRWRRYGCAKLVPPLQFLSVAEEIGLAPSFADWVLREACRQGARWQAAGCPIPIAVNLSPRQLGRSDLVVKIEAGLVETGLSAERLVLEMTEDTVMLHKEQAAERLGALKQLGVRIAVDDFGTGYSSLSYLRYLPFDILKMDRSFMSQVTTSATDQMLVQTVTNLGHALMMEVIAEGVEEPAQQEWAERLGCDTVQGYLCGRPMPSAQAEVLLRGMACP